MLERDVERRLKSRVEKMIPGSMCLKFVSPGTRGVPDRVILLAEGVTVWVELKRPGEEPRPEQTAIHRRMAKAGAVVLVVDSYEAVDLVVQSCYDWVTAFSYDDPVPHFPEKLMWYNWDKEVKKRAD